MTSWILNKEYSTAGRHPPSIKSGVLAYHKMCGIEKPQVYVKVDHFNYSYLVEKQKDHASDNSVHSLQ